MEESGFSPDKHLSTQQFQEWLTKCKKILTSLDFELPHNPPKISSSKCKFLLPRNLTTHQTCEFLFCHFV